ncbi:superoxide dismutase family protein [Bacillus carboniphilus]|uniref:Superoxide dismutase [Cu-Zn] n=1 Tax=Bacillus carboniphilus TaxID=86663 RepID=A0ABY9JU91_9BACI|nr:superoxide dismutase family protein [Bacillus carboniphilus]WLR41251.1 superoxide dismutase family protein [Bacillus carboniphilus]
MQKTFRTLVLAFIFLSGCVGDESITKMDVEMFNSNGDSLGTVKLTEEPEGVGLKVTLEGLPSGELGIHVHEFPNCEAPEFKTSGNHFNPDNVDHGLMHPDGAHAGDLPNLIVDSGKVDVELVGPQLTLKKGQKGSLFSQKGTSLIITSQRDDGMTQPSGDSGERIACGKITEEEAERKDKNVIEPEEE